jgi:hypothetical protein
MNGSVPRVVPPDVPHYITQRGNARRFILQGEAERSVCLDLLQQGVQTTRVELIDLVQETCVRAPPALSRLPTCSKIKSGCLLSCAIYGGLIMCGAIPSPDLWWNPSQDGPLATYELKSYTQMETTTPFLDDQIPDHGATTNIDHEHRRMRDVRASRYSGVLHLVACRVARR